MAISSGVIVIFTPCCGMGARGPYGGDATIIRYCGRIEFRSLLEHRLHAPWWLRSALQTWNRWRWRGDTRYTPYWCSRHAGDCGARKGHIWYKVVPFGEIETKPSDPKHVG